MSRSRSLDGDSGKSIRDEEESVSLRDAMRSYGRMVKGKTRSSSRSHAVEQKELRYPCYPTKKKKCPKPIVYKIVRCRSSGSSDSSSSSDEKGTGIVFYDGRVVGVIEDGQYIYVGLTGDQAAAQRQRCRGLQQRYIAVCRRLQRDPTNMDLQDELAFLAAELARNGCQAPPSCAA